MKDAKYELAEDTLKKLDFLQSALQGSMAKESIEKTQWENSLSNLHAKVRRDTIRKRGKERYYNQKVVDSLVEIAKRNIAKHELKVEEFTRLLSNVETYTIRVNRAKADFNVTEGTNYLLNKIGERDRTYQFDPMKEIQSVRKAVFTISGYRELL